MASLLLSTAVYLSIYLSGNLALSFIACRRLTWVAPKAVNIYLQAAIEAGNNLNKRFEKERKEDIYFRSRGNKAIKSIPVWTMGAEAKGS